MEMHSFSWTVYLYTPLWSDFFQRKYNLSSSDISICGIPGHWPLITSFLFSFTSSKQFPFDDNIMLKAIYQNYYLLKCQKISYLKELRKYVLDKGNILTIKLHPGERYGIIWNRLAHLLQLIVGHLPLNQPLSLHN